MKLGTYILWAAVAAGAGIFVLLGYFFDNEVIQSLRLILMRWAVLLAAAALLVGLFNLFAVHWNKVSVQDRGWPYSALLILAFLGTIVMGMFFGPDHEITLLLFNYIQLPVEASLMAILAVTLAVAGFRIVSQRRDLISMVFAGTALLILLGTGPWPVASESALNVLLGEIRNWLAQVWAAGAARGIVLGVALGSIVTGIRVLLAIDRPYGD